MREGGEEVGLVVVEVVNQGKWDREVERLGGIRNQGCDNGIDVVVLGPINGRLRLFDGQEGSENEQQEGGNTGDRRHHFGTPNAGVSARAFFTWLLWGGTASFIAVSFHP